jgi:S1-C subfamily serine protease
VSEVDDNKKVTVYKGPLFVSDDSLEVKKFARVNLVSVGKVEEGYDFAVIEADLNVPALTLGDEKILKGGDDIVYVGAPAGIGKLYYKGFVSLPRVDRPMNFDGARWPGAIMLQVPAESGCSGSSIVKDNKIVGILVGGDKAVTAAVPISRIYAPDKVHLRDLK